jgi:hypothetical protein
MDVGQLPRSPEIGPRFQTNLSGNGRNSQGGYAWPADKKVRDMTATFPSGVITYPFHRIAEDIYGNGLISTEIGFAAWDENHWPEKLSTNKRVIICGAGLLSDREGTAWIEAAG